MNHIARSLKTGDTSASDASPWPGRLEDDPLLRGQGRFIEDVLPDGAAFACFVRAPHAFATIRKCDAGAAEAAPLVLGVFTGADLADLGTVTAANPQPGRTGGQTISPHRPALAAGRVVHVGEPVVLIVADTLAAAQDAAELVEIEYEPHEAIIGARSAIAAGATSIWPEARGNVALDWAVRADPDGARKTAIDAIFTNAAHVTRLVIPNQRIAFASLEPRGAIASFDVESECFTLRVCSQGVSPIRNQAAAALHVKPEQMRVLTEDVGGGFGGKSMSYPEYVAILFAARALARPVRWMSGRSEAFLSDNQARDTISHAELALDADGRFLALRIDHVADMGAYLSAVSAFIQTSNFANCLPNIYDIPDVSLRVRCVFTNTVPVAPYRGAGRPEANFVIERLIDEAARETGRDPALLRKRNLIKPKQIPYTNAGGGVYDSGDFPAMFAKALIAADHKGFASRKKKSARAGLLRGFGIGCYLEIAGGVPEEMSSIRFPEANKIEVSMGSGPSGQGQVSVFTRVAAKRLQLDEKAVTLLFGDSSRDVFGIGAIGSRSAMLVAGAIVNVIDAMLVKARKLAAMLLQAGEAEIDYRDGVFTVRESGREISLLALAERATELARQGTISELLDTNATLKAKSSFPNGCHIAEIEIDPETGALTIAAYTAVDDCGNVLDPVIVEGQVHGAVAQGLGQALMEVIVFDADGQVVTGSFMDYAMPRADHSPNILALHHAVPCTTNPLGTKGTGEAGSTAAPSAIINAILDALPQAAHPHITMPATSEKIWRALQFAKNAALS